MTLFQQFKDALGKPKEGFHSLRVCGFATWDLLGALGLILALVYALGTSWWKAILLIIIITIGTHYLFGVQTHGMTCLGFKFK